jgi:hypothetical protein
MFRLCNHGVVARALGLRLHSDKPGAPSLDNVFGHLVCVGYSIAKLAIAARRALRSGR